MSPAPTIIKKENTMPSINCRLDYIPPGTDPKDYSKDKKIFIQKHPRMDYIPPSDEKAEPKPPNKEKSEEIKAKMAEKSVEEDNICHFCGKVCKSEHGKKVHLNSCPENPEVDNG